MGGCLDFMRVCVCVFVCVCACVFGFGALGIGCFPVGIWGSIKPIRKTLDLQLVCSL